MQWTGDCHWLVNCPDCIPAFHLMAAGIISIILFYFILLYSSICFGMFGQVSKQKSNLQPAQKTFNLWATPMICCIISLNRAISAYHWSNSGSPQCLMLSLCHIWIMKQLLAPALLPTHEISHGDHLELENFHREVVNCVHTATVLVYKSASLSWNQ